MPEPLMYLNILFEYLSFMQPEMDTASIKYFTHTLNSVYILCADAKHPTLVQHLYHTIESDESVIVLLNK